MKTRCTLTSLFEANKSELKSKLAGLNLFQDTEKIRSIIESYLQRMFNQEGEFRQNLSQAEDYILQSALMLLNAQQEMVKVMTTQPQTIQKKVSTKIEPQSKGLKKELYPHTLLGTAVGGAVGTLAGSWGAVFGAIAGTAVVLYYASTLQKEENTTSHNNGIEEEVKTTIDTTIFLEIIGRICKSVDNLIATFRTQIQRVVNKYEEQEPPTLENTYSSLLESIQSLLGVAYSKQPDEKRLNKIDQRIEQVADSLENYGLEIVKYSDENISLFEQFQSDKVTGTTMIYPAITKNGNLIKRGKVFVNKQTNK